jgi:hypothetical protein
MIEPYGPKQKSKHLKEEEKTGRCNVLVLSQYRGKRRKITTSKHGNELPESPRRDTP